MGRKQNLVFLIGLGLVPIAIVEGSLKSYLDIKICIQMAVTAVLAIDLLLKPSNIKMPPYLVIFAFYAFLQVILIGDIHNLGLQLQYISLVISALVIGVWVNSSNLSPSSICLALIPSIVITLVCSLSMYFYREPLLGNYSPWGAPVGLKNSLSVYLAQILPVLFLGLVASNRTPKWPNKAYQVFLALLTIFSVWIIFANRTRSAWWMVVCFLLVLVFIVRKKSQGAHLYKVFGLVVLTGALLTSLVPNALIWKSPTPYLDSLSTMTSPHQSSGRLELWKVASLIVMDNPLVGIGTGNYPTLWQKYIQESGINPEIFRPLRPDLNLFNDYLQTWVENGLFAFLIGIVLFLFYPLYLISKPQNNISTSLLLSACVMTAIDAFFDYPFHRPETILVFVTAISLALRELESPIKLSRDITTPVLCGVLLLSTFTGIFLGGAVYSRWSFSHTQEVGDLKAAWFYWPWDIQWDSGTIVFLHEKGEVWFARELAERRAKYWPNDEESHRMLALVGEP